MSNRPIITWVQPDPYGPVHQNVHAVDVKQRQVCQKHVIVSNHGRLAWAVQELPNIGD